MATAYEIAEQRGKTLLLMSKNEKENLDNLAREFWERFGVNWGVRTDFSIFSLFGVRAPYGAEQVVPTRAECERNRESYYGIRYTLYGHTVRKNGKLGSVCRLTWIVIDD